MIQDAEITHDLSACHLIRRAVFIDEQGISEPDEWDDLDDKSVHVLIRDGASPVATARLREVENVGIIGRICVLSSHRGLGLGARLVRFGVQHFETGHSVTQVKLSAQTHAAAFYEKLGFVGQGPIYDDAGIPHRDMVRAF